jgi:transposase-like protein
MNKRIRVTVEFKQDAVAQVLVREYAVNEVAQRQCKH